MIKRALTALAAGLLTLAAAGPAAAFCGFYVAKADTKMFNKASKVVMVRNDGKTVITMANDYQGDLKEFAIVVPVPQVLQRGQIHVTNNKIVDHLDAYTAPRLVEYFDKDPCRVYRRDMLRSGVRKAKPESRGRASAKSLGVKIEARYTVGEYDILILSARQSSGLQTWLIQEGYKVPPKARRLLRHYIDAGMKFFVARVNLKAQSKLGFSYLRPLQIAFESPRFMLPIRLGMVNAQGPQELFVFALTRGGRVVTKTYRTVQAPSNFNVPIFVREEFPAFYKAMFAEATRREGPGAVFMEYAWNMGRCDPCAANPLSPAELRELGVFWLDYRRFQPRPGAPPRRRWAGRAVPVYVTRLHFRYTAATHPDDLVFEETQNRRNFQGRYILRHPYKGEPRCAIADRYFDGLPARFEHEAQMLARFTGWDINTIRAKMEAKGQSFKLTGIRAPKRPWWQKLWPKKTPN